MENHILLLYFNFNKMRNFRNLKVWQSGMDLAERIYTLVGYFPSEEKYGLSHQMKRAVVSIPSNLAEGCSRRTNKERARFIEMATGSSFELETQLLIALRTNIISEEEIKPVLDEISHLQASLNSYYMKVSESKYNGYHTALLFVAGFLLSTLISIFF